MSNIKKAQEAIEQTKQFIQDKNPKDPYKIQMGLDPMTAQYTIELTLYDRALVDENIPTDFAGFKLNVTRKTQTNQDR